ncbi:hypothetical protein P170DRAFT_467966 [Aspergillus steynii IBT 23096]|uniref:Uncharacterized protein n=1 Tax=Aspergillus steynii IBT 23096 TaxID=1392250 RepID=A0A2I2FUH4_9EURO|nr:uncharacterized protein P170DRAFT_467966 [Aspergillus steynii IBT 23096]PLB44247.1 hypothetical protein P170DRAFT_467966 [Aspergillus steynii IBT 23096]
MAQGDGRSGPGHAEVPFRDGESAISYAAISSMRSPPTSSSGITRSSSFSLHAMLYRAPSMNCIHPSAMPYSSTLCPSIFVRRCTDRPGKPSSSPLRWSLPAPWNSISPPWVTLSGSRRAEFPLRGVPPYSTSPDHPVRSMTEMYMTIQGR